MPFTPVFLRVLLCISLVFYGSGLATAATTSQIQNAMAAASAGPPTDMTSGGTLAAPCHDASAVEMAAVHHAGMVGDDAQTATQGSPDCCTATGCDCSCAQHVPVATTVLSAGSAMAVSSTAASRMKAGHTSPPLPHQIRPPIG